MPSCFLGQDTTPHSDCFHAVVYKGKGSFKILGGGVGRVTSEGVASHPGVRNKTLLTKSLNGPETRA